MRKAGRHFLQIPGPSSVPDRILKRHLHNRRSITVARTLPRLAQSALEGLKTIFKTESNVFIYPASGTGAWEAALVNALSPGDKVLMYETGHFATLWKNLPNVWAFRLNSSRATGAAAQTRIRSKPCLNEDKTQEIKAVCVVHNETSTGSVSSHRGSAQGHRRGGPPRPVHGGYDLGSGVSGLPA